MDLAAVAPELRDRLRWLPRIAFGSVIIRRIVNALLAWAPAAKIEGVTIKAIASGGARFRLYIAKERRCRGALIWIHGGGFVIGRGGAAISARAGLNRNGALVACVHTCRRIARMSSPRSMNLGHCIDSFVRYCLRHNRRERNRTVRRWPHRPGATRGRAVP